MPPDDPLVEPPELLIGGSSGGSFIANAGVAETVKAAERINALKKIDFAIVITFMPPIVHKRNSPHSRDVNYHQHRFCGDC